MKGDGGFLAGDGDSVFEYFQKNVESRQRRASKSLNQRANASPRDLVSGKSTRLKGFFSPLAIYKGCAVAKICQFYCNIIKFGTIVKSGPNGSNPFVKSDVIWDNLFKSGPI